MMIESNFWLQVSLLCGTQVKKIGPAPRGMAGRAGLPHSGEVMLYEYEGVRPYPSVDFTFSASFFDVYGFCMNPETGWPRNSAMVSASL